MRQAALRWGPALAWAAGIFWLSSRSTLYQPPGLLAWDKLQHAAAYALGAFLIARGTGARGRGPLLAAALAALYGVSDEIHQSFVPGRNSDVLDCAADAVGALAGALAYRSIHTWRTGRGNPAAAGGADAVRT